MVVPMSQSVRLSGVNLHTSVAVARLRQLSVITELCISCLCQHSWFTVSITQWSGLVVTVQAACLIVHDEAMLSAKSMLTMHFPRSCIGWPPPIKISTCHFNFCVNIVVDMSYVPYPLLQLFFMFSDCQLLVQAIHSHAPVKVLNVLKAAVPAHLCSFLESTFRNASQQQLMIIGGHVLLHIQQPRPQAQQLMIQCNHLEGQLNAHLKISLPWRLLPCQSIRIGTSNASNEGTAQMDINHVIIKLATGTMDVSHLLGLSVQKLLQCCTLCRKFSEILPQLEHFLDGKPLLVVVTVKCSGYAVFFGICGSGSYWLCNISGSLLGTGSLHLRHIVCWIYLQFLSALFWYSHTLFLLLHGQNGGSKQSPWASFIGCKKLSSSPCRFAPVRSPCRFNISFSVQLLFYSRALHHPIGKLSSGWHWLSNITGMYCLMLGPKDMDSLGTGFAPGIDMSVLCICVVGW